MKVIDRFISRYKGIENQGAGLKNLLKKLKLFERKLSTHPELENMRYFKVFCLEEEKRQIPIAGDSDDLYRLKLEKALKSYDLFLKAMIRESKKLWKEFEKLPEEWFGDILGMCKLDILRMFALPYFEEIDNVFIRVVALGTLLDSFHRVSLKIEPKLLGFVPSTLRWEGRTTQCFPNEFNPKFEELTKLFLSEEEISILRTKLLIEHDMRLFIAQIDNQVSIEQSASKNLLLNKWIEHRLKRLIRTDESRYLVKVLKTNFKKDDRSTTWLVSEHLMIVDDEKKIITESINLNVESEEAIPFRDNLDHKKQHAVRELLKSSRQDMFLKITESII